ncbi:GyrI-like domain-containing protein [Pelotomaculum propionicicum]|uniref:GyrI-like domain-containing protein n=1 Tax=Pelotomaculum propionicicum TaxID=258475 RepID=UPI003B7980BE
MPAVDFKKELKQLYNISGADVVIIDVPPMNFLMVDGAGNPNTTREFQEAVEVLYGVSYALKFRVKKAGLTNYVVMPLEGLWWTESMAEFDPEDKGKWKWTLMIMQPEFVTEEYFNEAVSEIGKKKDIHVLSKIRYERYSEGLSAQIMHIGPYNTEGPDVAKLHNFILENGYVFAGKHHEVYLSDPRRVKTEKIKTLIRQPIRLK